MDMLGMWCVSLFYGMYFSFRRVKRGKKQWQDKVLMPEGLLLPEGIE